MKSYADLEQSKKLAEILPLESADMLFQFGKDRYVVNIRVPLTKEHWEQMMPDINPCWSLAALLSVMKEPEIIRNSEGTWLIRGWYNRYPFSRGGYNNLVDACYDMILKLHELNLL